jgi:hypothetical protein
MGEKSIEPEMKLLEELAYGLDKNINRVWAKKLKPILCDEGEDDGDMERLNASQKEATCKCDLVSKIQKVNHVLTRVIAVQSRLQIRLEL